MRFELGGGGAGEGGGGRRTSERILRAATAAEAIDCDRALPVYSSQLRSQAVDEGSGGEMGEQEATPTVQSCTSETALSGPLPPHQRALPESRDKRRK